MKPRGGIEVRRRAGIDSAYILCSEHVPFNGHALLSLKDDRGLGFREAIPLDPDLELAKELALEWFKSRKLHLQGKKK